MHLLYMAVPVPT